MYPFVLEAARRGDEGRSGLSGAGRVGRYYRYSRIKFALTACALL